MKKKIVIADDDPITKMDIKEMLESSGYDVVGKAADGFDAIEQCRKNLPDLVVMDIKMPLIDGLTAAKIIDDENLAGAVLILTAYSNDEFIQKAKEAKVIGYVVKPVDEKNLLPAVEIAIAKAEEIKKMKNDVQDSMDKLNARKKIEKAKGILMDKYRISEEEAFRRLRTLSMDKRCSMKDIASAIIISKDI
jgi:response regulator NasT